LFIYQTLAINQSDIRCIERNNVDIEILKSKTVLKIGKQTSGVHYVQYKKPLTSERRFFFVELIKLDSNSNVVIGVSSEQTLDECLPSKLLPGQADDSVGYFSKNGLMLYNNKSHGNMMGHRCSRG
jgi:hypothetical protein